MIRSFKDRATRRFFEGHRVATLQGFANQDSAESVNDLASLSGNRLEALKDDGPYDVEIVDYH